MGSWREGAVVAGVVLLALGAGACGRGGTGSGKARLTLALPAGAGTVTVEDLGGDVVLTCDQACSDRLKEGTYVLRASDGGGRFAGWLGADSCGVEAFCVVPLTSSREIEARFVADVNLVLSGQDGRGHVTSTPAGIDCPGDCSDAFPFGSTVTLAADTGPWFFIGWEDACPFGQSCDVTAGPHRTVSARFEPGQMSPFGGAGTQRAGAVAADPLDPLGYYVVGVYDSSFMLGTTPLVHDGVDGNRAFAARFGADGTPVWATSFGGTGDLKPLAAAASEEGGDRILWIAGLLVGEGDEFPLDGFDGQAAYAGGPIDPVGDTSFLVRIPEDDPASGWVRFFPGAAVANEALIRDIALIGTTEVMVTGVFRGQVNFGAGGVSTGSTVREQIFLARYQADDGTFLRVDCFGRNQNNTHAEAHAVVADTPGAAWLGGTTDDNLDVSAGGCQAGPVTEHDGWVARVNTGTGQCEWVRLISLGGTELVTGLARGGGMIVAAGTRTTTTWFVRAYEEKSGAEQWSRVWPGDDVDVPDIAWDPVTQTFLVAGHFFHDWDVLGLSVPGIHGDVVTLRLSPLTGDLVSVHQYGGAAQDELGAEGDALFELGHDAYGGGLAVLGSGYSVVAGYTRSTALGPAPIPWDSDDADALLLRLAP